MFEWYLIYVKNSLAFYIEVMGMSSFLNVVGEQIKKFGLARVLTQEQLSEITRSMGISKSRISDIERGTTNISLGKLEVLMDALEIVPNKLFYFPNIYTEMDEEKDILLNKLYIILRQRDLEDVKYVVRTTQNYLDTIDAKKK